jgi:F0F1-type ATP synthase assembly protein I
MNDMVQQPVGAARGTDRFVRSSPWRAVGTMALAGLAAGILVSQGAQWRQRRSAAGRQTQADSEVSGG